MGFSQYVEIAVGSGLGLAPPVAVNLIGLDQTLQMIPETITITRAMTLIGATLGLALGHHIRATNLADDLKIRWTIGAGVVSAVLWMANFQFVGWATSTGRTSGWTVIISATLVFVMFVAWCTTATMAGVVSVRSAESRGSPA